MGRLSGAPPPPTTSCTPRPGPHPALAGAAGRCPGLSSPITSACLRPTGNVLPNQLPLACFRATGPALQRLTHEDRHSVCCMKCGAGCHSVLLACNAEVGQCRPAPVKPANSCTRRLRLSKNLALSSSDESHQPAGASSHQLSHSVPTLKARTRSKDFSNTKRFGVPPSLEDPAGDSSKNPDPKVPRQPGHPSRG